MPHRIGEILKSQRGNQTGTVSHDQSDRRWGMVSSFHRPKLVSIRGGVLAAPVRIRGRIAFAFEAAIRSLTRRRAACDAVKRPDEQNDCQETDRYVKATTHSI
jgi:hypothetical protein